MVQAPSTIALSAAEEIRSSQSRHRAGGGVTWDRATGSISWLSVLARPAA